MALDREVLRKLVHVAFGFCALLLRWLSPWQAAALAAAAFLYNWLVLPHLFGTRIARSPRGTDLGIVLYPAAVFFLIVLFPGDPGVAAAVWAIMAFGDGGATLAGRLIGGPRLPWNRSKSVAGSLTFVLAGSVAAWQVASFVQPDPPYAAGWISLAVVTAIACAIAESLDLRLDDNFVVPLVGALLLAALTRISREPEPRLGGTELLWLGANGALALGGWLGRSVTLSGAAGGFALGAILIAFAGWELYVVLVAFFVVGTAVTRLGWQKKEAAGLAQERGGRRGFSHAWSNVGVAAIVSLLIAAEAGSLRALWLGAIAALATATADTTASEIGQLFGRRTFLPLSLRQVPRGTEGAISLEGTLAGALAGGAVGALGVALAHDRIAVSFGAGTLIVTTAAILASWLESVAGSWNRNRSVPVPNGALNFFNTLAGALIAIALYWGAVAL
ncbi:MAG TPA: DUF92 domain-containing protein [Thermoanaerobaculia bacterium]|nr:DUF92 domain-containing protein [Thermoanaerobaculia bacterium]